MRRAAVVLSGAAAAAVLAGTALITTDPRGATPAQVRPAAASCAFYRVHRDGLGLSTLTRVDLRTGGETTLRTLDQRVDALGHADGRLYALAAGGRDGVYLPSRLFTLDLRGNVLASAPLGGALLGGLVIRGGGVAGGRFYAVTATALLTIRLSDAVVEARRPITPLLSGLGVDDLALRAADGQLYGVATPLLAAGPGRLVRINPATGALSWPPSPQLPPSASYGAVTFGSDGALYAMSNRTAGRARLYRAPLGGTPQEVAVAPSTTFQDASECVAVPAPPPPTATPPTVTPPITTPPTTTPRPPGPPGATTVPATTTPPSSVSPEPAPGAPPPEGPTPPAALAPPAVVPPPPEPSGAPAAPGMPAQVRQRAQEEEEQAPTPKQRAQESTEKKRRWGLTTLALLFGAGAAAASSRSGSRRR
ncbi:hypothetical protein [Actinokineospora bangkokensis]|uniref:Uncharacterized protein n=1 Tax=Actinokineospora bangkokensis TaxID=1193682 RepID=A0A1Q9LBK6_9PSEU|nr:hypothetical protein [Actinokineospora bangkokensis]OLR89427.1 hypothetical protein BJP25_04885 [Actinokineospora bangkokensis]